MLSLTWAVSSDQLSAPPAEFIRYEMFRFG
jgi:hypothetical protein